MLSRLWKLAFRSVWKTISRGASGNCKAARSAEGFEGSERSLKSKAQSLASCARQPISRFVMSEGRTAARTSICEDQMSGVCFEYGNKNSLLLGLRL